MHTPLDLAWNEIQTARQYTVRLLDNLRDEDWFRMGPAGVSHIAWQVGHLAMAEYRLVLDRLRGELADDAALISAEFLTAFGRTSTPQADAALYPTIAQIRQVFDRVHAQCAAEMASFASLDLDAAPLKPHPLFQTKLGSLFWCARHEMLHAGQIGLLRRELGYDPQW